MDRLIGKHFPTDLVGIILAYCESFEGTLVQEWLLEDRSVGMQKDKLIAIGGNANIIAVLGVKPSVQNFYLR